MKVLAGITVLCASLVATGVVMADRTKVDTNGDGAVSLAEMQAVRPGMTQERFAGMDKNGDGLLSRDERPNGRRHGPKMDTNGDGSIDLGEFQTVRPGMTAEKFAELDTNNDGLLGRDERPGRRNHTERFTALDIDGSGGVSLEEMEAGKNAKVAEHFARMDTDGNGEISLEEHQARAQKRHQRGERPEHRRHDDDRLQSD